MAKSSQGSFLTFDGTTLTVTSVSVRAPKPEIVNVTSKDDPPGKIMMRPTGEFTEPGAIEVEALGFENPADKIGKHGQLTFSTAGGTISNQWVICSDVSAEARVGDLLRLRMAFTLTDYTG